MGSRRAEVTRLVVRSNLRRRWLSLVAVAVVAGLGMGVVLAAVAGARRTLSAPERLYKAQLMPDVALFASPTVDPALVAALEAAPAVASVQEIATVPVRLPDDAGLNPDAVTAGQTALQLWGPGAGVDMRVPRVVEGRLPDPAVPGEAVVTPAHAARLGVDVGSTFTATAYSAADVACAMQHACPLGDPSVPVPVTIVGIVRFPDELDGDAFSEQPLIEMGPATAAALHGAEGVVSGIVGVTLDRSAPSAPSLDGSAAARFASVKAYLEGLAGAQAVDGLTIAPTDASQISSMDALRMQAVGLVLGGALLALASLGAGGVLFSRHLLPAIPEQTVLVGLGLTRRQRLAPAVAEALLAAAGAAGSAVAIAIALSPLLPYGVGRQAEPDPGLALDGLVLAGGGAAIVAVLAATLVVVAHRSLLRPAAHRRSGLAPSLAGRLRLQPVPATGARFALEGRADGRRAPVLLTVGTAGVAAALVTGALVVAGSIDRVLSVPAASGSPWDGFATQTGEPDAAALEHAKELAADPRVTATARVGQGPLPVAMPGNPGDLWAVGIEPVRGEIAPTVLSGRAPSGPDEVLVGREVRDTFHLRLGDPLYVEGPDGPHGLRVVGVGLLPVVNQDANAWAVVLPLQTLVDLGGFARSGQSESGIAYRVADRGDLDDVNREAEALVGNQTIALPARIPGKVSALAAVDELPTLLAALVGVLGLLTIGFGLVLAVRQRRHELGVLRALGFRAGDARTAVHWQGVVTAVAGLVVGLPAGAVFGRQVWRIIAGVVDADPAPVMSARMLVVLAASVLAAGLALSIGPAWRAGRLAPAASLRSE